MRILLEIKIDDELVDKTGYNIDEFADLSKEVLKSYWFDEGIKLKDGTDDTDETKNAIINIYKECTNEPVTDICNTTVTGSFIKIC